MMHFVRSSDRLKIEVVRFSQKLKPLMNEDIMYKEIGESVEGDSQTNPEQEIIALLHAKKQSGNSGNGKNQEEEIIVFKKAFGLFFVMVFVKNPEQTMHNILMGEPCHKFHTGIRNDDNGRVCEYCNHIRQIFYLKCFFCIQK
jgi:hypothetical protein